MIDSRFPALSNAIVNSALWRAGEAVADAITRAWLNSATARIVATAGGVARVSTAASIGVLAGVVALAAQFAMPIYVRSGLPVFWPLTAIGALMIVALAASAFERAWPHSAIARWLAPPYVR